MADTKTKLYEIGSKRQVGYRLDCITADKIDCISRFYNSTASELIDYLLESNLSGGNFLVENGDLEKIQEELKPYEKAEKLIDTVIAPSLDKNFQDMFLGNGYWNCIGLSPRMAITTKLKYFACYESAPISAVRFYAEIDKIVQNPVQKCKYDIYLKKEIIRLPKPVVLFKTGAGLRHFKYTSLNDLLNGFGNGSTI